MYHVVPGSHFSEGLRDSMWLPTLVQDKELQVRISSDGYTRKSKFEILVFNEIMLFRFQKICS